MSDLALILVIIGTLFGVYQMWLFAWAVAVSRQGGNVTVGLLAGAISAALFIAAVLV